LKELVILLYTVKKTLFNKKTNKLVSKVFKMAVTREKAESFYVQYVAAAKLDVYNDTCYAIVILFEPATHTDGELMIELPKQTFKEERIEALVKPVINDAPINILGKLH
jgi:hypothetical protein